MKLNILETKCLLAIITGNFSAINPNSHRISMAFQSLRDKGFLRKNKHNILEINLGDNYFEQIGE